jgi:Glycine/sarcosine/betaine reductase component B subunits
VENTLEVNLDELQTLLEIAVRLQSVRLDLAHPGEPCRSGRLFDGIARCARGDGEEDFPGVLGIG